MAYNKKYYLIINKNNYKYYCNISSNPSKSIESHIRKANNPNSKRYNTELHQALRIEGIENFEFYILDNIPDWVQILTRYSE